MALYMPKMQLVRFDLELSKRMNFFYHSTPMLINLNISQSEAGLGEMPGSADVGGSDGAPPPHIGPAYIFWWLCLDTMFMLYLFI